MDFNQIITELSKKIYHPVYFLSGEEPYFIDEITEVIEQQVLSPAEKEFNQSVFYGRDISVEQVVSACRRYPMMAAYQVIILKEAQYLDSIEELEGYLKNPVSTTILVINYKYKKLDKRTSFARQLKKSAVWFESKKIYDNKIPGWIEDYLQKKSYKITAKASQIVADHLGSDLSRIRNELSKLFINIAEGSTINEDHIEEYIGISKEFNVFEFQNALGSLDHLKAMQIALFFGANPKVYPLQMILVVLYNFMIKVMMLHYMPKLQRNQLAAELGVSPFFVSDYQKAARNYSKSDLARIISLLQEMDLKSKGIGNQNTDDSGLLIELVYQIMN